MSELEDEILIGEGVKLTTGAAPITLRIASALIDGIVLLVALWGSSAVVGALLANANEALAQAISTAWIVSLAVLGPAIVETLTRGLSAGRLATGIRIVRDDGGPVSFRQAFGRAVLALLEVYATAGTFALVTALVSKRGKRLGDMMSGTYALRVRTTVPPLAPLTMPPSLAQWASTADISRLPDGLALTARLFVSRAPAMHAEARARLGNKIASRLAEHVAPQPPITVHPEYFIMAVIAARRDREYAQGLKSAARQAREAELLQRLPYGVPDVPN